METVIAALIGAVLGIAFGFWRAFCDEIAMWYDWTWKRRGEKPEEMVWVRCGGCRRYGEILKKYADIDRSWVCGCGYENELTTGERS